MSALEQTIFEIVRNLDESQQQRVLEFVKALQPAKFDDEAWFKELQSLEAELRQKYGENFATDVQTMLDELREERSWIRP
jgi:hypothetical protein